MRFVSINDKFDTTDGLTNRNKSAYIQSSTRIPLVDLFNEHVPIETKMKVEALIDMKAQHGEDTGPRAPSGYLNFSGNSSQLVPDPVAAVIVRKIFELGGKRHRPCRLELFHLHHEESLGRREMLWDVRPRGR